MRTAARNGLVAVAVISAVMLMPNIACADGLTGSVTVSWLFPDASTTIITGPVAIGSSISCTATSIPPCDPLSIVPGSEIAFSVASSSITYTGTGWGSPSADYKSGTTPGGTPITFNGFEFSNLTFASGESLGGFSLTTDLAGLTASDITFGPDFIEVNMAGLPGGGDFTLDLIPTPEPGTLTLFVLGLIGVAALAWRQRKPASLP